jgi:hypothetical protein
MLMTIKQYCEARNVTKQFVGEYIKKGKIPSVELPVFAEYEGERIQVGSQKFVLEQGLPTSGMNDRQRAKWMSDQATQHQGIRADIIKVLLAKQGGKQLREELTARYAASDIFAEYQSAMAAVCKLLFAEAQELLGNVKALSDEE